MIGVDSNILVHAHRGDSPFHKPAADTLRELAEGAAAWALPWPCLHEFLAIVTHPRIFKPPTAIESAMKQVESWLESPSLALLGESAVHWQVLGRLIDRARCMGPVIHDARVAAICIQHGVDVLLTADRDFSKFPELRTRNPLVGETRRT